MGVGRAGEGYSQTGVDYNTMALGDERLRGSIYRRGCIQRDAIMTVDRVTASATLLAYMLPFDSSAVSS